jgi:hypothetical protein
VFEGGNDLKSKLYKGFQNKGRLTKTNRKKKLQKEKLLQGVERSHQCASLFILLLWFLVRALVY